jgi:acetoin utilization deacetylase AcuC-like enzyme
MAIAYISHFDCTLHDMGHHHPEQPARLNAINDRLIATGLEFILRQYDAPLVTRELLEAVHDASYVDEIFAAAPTEGIAWVDGDTAMNKHSLNAALRAAGAVVLGVDLVMEDRVKQVFCGVRPPGHHAERHRAMGFCLFNNIAVGARHAVDRWGLQRVLVVDFDVHHGNGTEDILGGDERFLFCSTFQHPFYPHSGYDSQLPNVVDAPLPAGAGSEDFRTAVETHWMPRIEAFEPELVMISAGFDAHQADDMASLNLVDRDYHWITRRLCDQADRTAGGRVVSSLEGGYDLHALARCVEAHLKAFLGEN